MSTTDPAAPAGEAAVAGESPAAGQPATAPSLAAAAAARRAEVRAKVLAGAHRSATAAPAPAATPAAPAPAASSEAQPAPAAAPVADPATPADPPADPATPDGQALLRKQEQHLRRQLATERANLQAEFDQQRAGWQQKLGKAAELEQRIARAGKDPIALVELAESAGYSAADFEALAQLFYAHSPEGQKDPRRKETARAALRNREQASSVAELKKELTDLRQELKQRDQHASTQAYLMNYASSVAKAVTDATPFAKAALAKNPQLVHQQFLDIGARLYHESGPSDDMREEPTAEAVLKAYEAERAAELELYGVDVKALRGAPAPAAPAAPAAKPTPKPTANGTKPNGRLSRDELLAKIEENKKRLAAARS